MQLSILVKLFLTCLILYLISWKVFTNSNNNKNVEFISFIVFISTGVIGIISLLLEIWINW